MKTYQMNLTEFELKDLKIWATMSGMNLKEFILIATREKAIKDGTVKEEVK